MTTTPTTTATPLADSVERITRSIAWEHDSRGKAAAFTLAHSPSPSTPGAEWVAKFVWSGPRLTARADTPANAAAKLARLVTGRNLADAPRSA